MSGDFLWELEKLRRRFGLDAEELRLAVRELTRKQRGIKQQEHTGEITRARKNRIAARQIKYWGTIEELADLVGDDSLKGKAIVDRLAKMLQGDPMAHAILLDVAECLQRRVLRDNNISDLDRDHLERAAFHQRTFEPPDGTGRRKLLAAHMRIVEALLRELRAVQKIT